MRITEHYAWTRLTEEQQWNLRKDPALFSNWMLREQLRVADSFSYTITNYGTIVTAEGVPPQALGPLLWSAQKEKIIPALEQHKIDMTVDKTRRCGLTTITSVYEGWKAGLSRLFPTCKEVNISMGQRESDEIMDLIRLFLDELPPYLRPIYGAHRDPSSGKKSGRDTVSFIRFANRQASIKALPATPRAGRSLAATDLFLDELAHYPAGLAAKIITSSRSVTEGGGRRIVGSSGNKRIGDGKSFYDIALKDKTSYEAAIARGDPPTKNFIFVSVWEREDRTKEWYDAERLEYPTDADFQQENPETFEQSFGGGGAGMAYSEDWLAACLKLGAEYDRQLAAFEIANPLDDELWLGADWGKNSAAVYLHPLKPFDLYVRGEFLAYETSTLSAETFSAGAYAQAKLLERQTPAGQLWGGYQLRHACYDAAGAQQAISLRNALPEDVSLTPVPFGEYKTTTVEFARVMMRRTFEGQELGRMAISPTGCPQLVKELQSLEVDEEGKIIKPKSGGVTDHAHDAWIAVLAPWADKWANEYRS